MAFKFNPFLLLPLGLFVGFGAGVTIAYHQATSLPGWYTQAQQLTATNHTTTSNSQQVQEKLRSLGQTNAEVVLSQQEVNDLLNTSLDRSHAQTSNSIQGIHAELHNNKLTAGVVLDLSTLQTSDTTSPEQTLLSSIMRRIPGIKDQKLYLGLETQPNIVNGKLQLDPNTQVKVGNLSFNLLELSEQLDITPQQVEQTINRTLPDALAQSSITQIEVKDNNLVLRSKQ